MTRKTVLIAGANGLIGHTMIEQMDGDRQFAQLRQDRTIPCMGAFA